MKQRVIVSILFGLMLGGAAVAVAFAQAAGRDAGSPADDGELMPGAPVTLSAAEDETFRATWPHGRSAPAPDSPIKRHSTTSTDGEGWSFTTYTNVAGEICSGVRLPGGGQGISCAPIEVLRSEPIFVSEGGSQYPAGDPTRWSRRWISGFAFAPVATVDVLLTDCSTRELEVDSDGAFLLVAGSRLLKRDVWPYKVRGFDAAGRIVAEKALLIEVPDTPVALAAGTKAPRPGPECA